MIPEIVKRAMTQNVTDIGQLSAEEVRTLNQYVKKGYLSKGKGGVFPAVKTVWAVPGYDFAEARDAAIRQILAECEAVGEKVTITFEGN
jgi:hypothetical protein